MKMINLGTNGTDGDSLRVAFEKCNENFAYLYAHRFNGWSGDEIGVAVAIVGILLVGFIIMHGGKKRI